MAAKLLMPADFRQVAEAIGKKSELIALYGVSEMTIGRWIAKTGARLESRYGRSMPSGFAADAAVMHMAALERRYNAGTKTVRRWFDECGMEPIKPPRENNPRFRATPEDFVQMAEQLTLTGLRYHYDAAPETIRRWCKETGAVPQVAVNIPPRPQPRRGAIHAMGISSNITASRRASTVHDIAADTLRRERFVVYRCDDRGRADIAGKFWRVGMTVLDDDQLLAKAARYERRAA